MLKTKLWKALAFALLICFAMFSAISAGAEVVASGSCGANVTYTLDSNGVLTISGKGSMENYSAEGAAPWSDQRSSITSVVVQFGVTNVGEYAFMNCDNLKSVAIGEDVTVIGQSAFNDCGSLATVKTCNGVTRIGARAFKNCTSLKTMSIHGSDHVESVVPAVAPTCTETGLTEGKVCGMCGLEITAQTVVPATGHTEVVEEGYAATCTETGLTDGKICFVCETVLAEQEVIPALGHTEVIDLAVAPTTTSTGLTEGKHCSVCGEVLVAQEVVPMLPEATPTTEPEVTPTVEPEVTPTTEPEVTPTTEPEVTPTTEPEVTPTVEPEVTDAPTDEPTDAPTTEPTDEPTDEPTTEPTDAPTSEPPAQPTEVPTLAQVQNLTGKPVDTNATYMKWSAVSGATGYQILRSTSSGGSFSFLKNVDITEARNYSLTPGGTYYYKVRAYKVLDDGSKIFGPESEAVKIFVLGKCNNFDVFAVDTNASRMTWDKVANATGYQVFRTVAGSGTYAWVKNNGTPGVNNYSLTPGTTYYYKIRAYIDLPDGSRAYGQFTDGKKVHILGKIKNLSIKASGTTLTLNWDDVSNITGYQVFYTIAGTGGEYKWVKNITASEFKHSGLKAKTDYYYKIRAYVDQPNGTRAYGQFSEAVHKVTGTGK